MIEIQKITDVLQYLDGLEAVVFDLDDTLYSEKEYVKSGYAAVASILPYVENAKEKLWEAFVQGKPAIDHLLHSEEIYSEEVKQKCLDIYRYHQPTIHLYDEVIDIFAQLRKKDLRIAILTDGRPEGQRAKIKALGLEELVDCFIITDELGGVGYRKPNQTAFVKMKETLNVEFEKMCYIGDNIDKDFIAPDLLGIRSIYFHNSDGIYCRR